MDDERFNQPEREYTDDAEEPEHTGGRRGIEDAPKTGRQTYRK